MLAKTKANNTKYDWTFHWGHMGTRINLEVTYSPITGQISVERHAPQSDDGSSRFSTANKEALASAQHMLKLKPEQAVSLSPSLLKTSLKIDETPKRSLHSQTTGRQPLLVRESEKNELPHKNQRALSHYQATQAFEQREAIASLFSVDIKV